MRSHACIQLSVLPLVRIGVYTSHVLGSGFYARGEGFDDKSSLEVLKRAFELGISLLNTADFYGPETNEELIGLAPTLPPAPAHVCMHVVELS